MNFWFILVGDLAFIKSIPLDWLMGGNVHKLVVVIADCETGESKERWNFDIQTDKEVAATYVI